MHDTEGNYGNHSHGIKGMRSFKRSESESLAAYFRSIVDICKLNLSLVLFTTVCSFLMFGINGNITKIHYVFYIYSLLVIMYAKTYTILRHSTLTRRLCCFVPIQNKLDKKKVHVSFAYRAIPAINDRLEAVRSDN